MAEAGQHNEFKLRVPERFVVADRGKDVTLSCHLSPETSAAAMTIRWFKEKECIYLYKNGQVIEGRGYEGRVSLDTQELKRGNVSLRLRDYRKSDEGVHICQVIYGGQKVEDTVGLWNRRVWGLVFFPDASTQLEAEQYLQRESPEDTRKRKESARCLEIQLEYKHPEDIHRLIKNLEDKDRHLEEKETQLDQMTQQVKEKEELRKDLLDKNNQVKQLTVQLQEKDSELEKRNQRLREKEGELEERDQQLKRLESKVKETQKKLQEKDKQLGERDKLLKERDRHMEDVKNKNNKLAGQYLQRQSPEAKRRREESDYCLGSHEIDQKQWTKSLHDILDELVKDHIKKFKLHLETGYKDKKGIPAGALENIDTVTLVKLLLQYFGVNDSVIMTRDALKSIPRNDLQDLLIPFLSKLGETW